MYIPGDFGRPPPSQMMSKNIANTFLNSSLYPVTTVDSNSVFRIKPDEFQFETSDGIHVPDVALNIPRTPLLITDPSTYISVSPFTENNIRKYHSAIGNLNHDNIKNPLSLKEITSQYKPDQLPLGSGVNPLVSDYFKPVHLTPGCIAEIVSFVGDPSPSSSGTNFNLPGRSNTINAKNSKMKLWGNNKKGGEESSSSVPITSELKQPKSSLSRSNSTFITKVSTTDSLTRKLNAASQLMVSVHGRFLNIMNLNDDFTKMEVDIPYVRVLFTVGVITTLSTFRSKRDQEKNLDVVVGFSSGDLVWINPFKMKYSRFNKNAKLCNKPVTSLQWSPCGRFVHAGFSNGEIMVFNRDWDDDENYHSSANVKREQYAKFFRSLPSHQETNPMIHYQVSHKPITSIRFNPIVQNMCCITSDDGFLKLVDTNNLYICDISPSYYGGFLCSTFTKDGKYLLVGGEDDFISVFEITAPSNAGNIKLIARLEGPASWIRSIEIDYVTSETNLIYKVSSVGDDGILTFWEFQPRNLPKIKKPLHHRTKSATSPNLKTVNSGFFQQQKGAHRRKISNLSPGVTSSPRHKHSNSVSSLTSAGAHPHLSIAQAMNSPSQLSLGKINSANVEMKNSIVTSRKSLSKDTIWAPINTECIVHATVGLNGVPILNPIASHDIGLGRLSGLWFDKKYIWVFTCGGNLIRWVRP